MLQNIKYWLRTPIHQLVIVDYNCPDNTAREVIKKYDKEPRITLLRLGAAVAGPFFNQARAKNIGVQAANSETLFFLDADCVMSPTFLEDYIERANNREMDWGEDLCTFAPVSKSSTFEEVWTESNWQLYNQFITRNCVFYACNGFNEFQPSWGANAIDMQIRIANVAQTKFIANSSQYRFMTRDHDDAERDKFTPTKIYAPEFGGRKRTFEESLQFYSKLRDISVRAQPGMKFGLSEYSPHVTMIVGGLERNFNPGDY